MTPEQKARVNIDALLTAAGWHVCNVANANIHAGDGAAKGVAAVMKGSKVLAQNKAAQRRLGR